MYNPYSDCACGDDNSRIVSYVSGNYYSKSSLDRYLMSQSDSKTSYSFTMPTTYATCLIISRYDVTALQYADNVFSYTRLFGADNNYKLNGGSFNASTQKLTLNFANTMWGGVTIYNCGT